MLFTEEPQSSRTLIDDLLAEQQNLTAVERFSRRHERNDLPSQSRYYRELIPLTEPLPGQQYAFAVDLDNCTACKACVSACHSLNGLDEDEIWRNVGLIHGGAAEEPYQQTITTACHHCAEPACMLGCPVKAYEKDEKTGIVRHLDDQCIGCQYCVLKCPYDVPKYSEKRGIVRKCDMCHGRLSVGEAPACVQACPSGAITIRIVDKATLGTSIGTANQMVPGAFDSGYTRPSTTYTSRRGIAANARPGDDTVLRLEHAHWPLIWMLILTQVAVGIFIGAAALAFAGPGTFQSAGASLAVAGFLFLNLGLAVSVLHLGRPLGAWRAFLGLRTSWMSREIFAFGIFAACAAAFTGTALWKFGTVRLPQLRLIESLVNPASFAVPLAVLTAILGMIGVFCSAMIYIDTRRSFWNRSLTFTNFLGSTLVSGTAITAVVLAWSGLATHATEGGGARVFALMALILRLSLFLIEFDKIRNALRDKEDRIHRSALVVWTLCRRLAIASVILFVCSMPLGLLGIGAGGEAGAVSMTLFFLLTFASLVIERYFFFTAVVAPRMPGPLVTTQLSRK